MKKHLTVAIIIFVLVASLSLASNFIRWDETPLEQTVFALPLGVGLLLEIPFLALMGLIKNGMHGQFISDRTLWILIPFIAGFCYSGLYYLIVYGVRKLLNAHSQKEMPIT